MPNNKRFINHVSEGNMPDLISDLFINAAILVSFISLGNQLLREKGSKSFSTSRRNIIVGFFSGF